MKRFSLVCCLILMLNMFCPAVHVHAEGITTPTDLPGIICQECGENPVLTMVSSDPFRHYMACPHGRADESTWENHVVSESNSELCGVCGAPFLAPLAIDFTQSDSSINIGDTITASWAITGMPTWYSAVIDIYYSDASVKNGVWSSNDLSVTSCSYTVSEGDTVAMNISVGNSSGFVNARGEWRVKQSTSVPMWEVTMSGDRVSVGDTISASWQYNAQAPFTCETRLVSRQYGANASGTQEKVIWRTNDPSVTSFSYTVTEADRFGSIALITNIQGADGRHASSFGRTWWVDWCEYCGAGTSYIYGHNQYGHTLMCEKNNHSLSSQKEHVYDESSVCTRCGYACSHFNVCTTKDELCDYCGMPWSEVFHSTYFDNNDTTHWEACALGGCGEKIYEHEIERVTVKYDMYDYAFYKCLVCDWRVMVQKQCSNGEHTVLCTAPTVCIDCGETGSFSNPTISHNNTTQEVDFLKKDDERHYIICEGCGEYELNGPHYIYCDVVGLEQTCLVCGYAITENTKYYVRHVAADCTDEVYSQYDETHHWDSCDVCNEKYNKREHTYDENHVCSLCGYEHVHVWYKQNETPATCTAAGEIVYSCSGCDELKTEILPIQDHTTEWQWDTLRHWQECVYCGQEEEYSDHSRQCTATACESCGYDGEHYMNVNHNFGEMHAYNEYYHQTICADCGYKETTKHWHPDDSYNVCVECGAQFENEHYHTMGEDGYETDENGHWFTCVTCGVATAPVAHSYTCKGLCFACGYEGSDNLAVSHAWSGLFNAGDYHYMICSDCGIRISSQIHWVSCENPGVCLDCGATNVTNGNVSHSLTGEYKYDATKHWQECMKCGAKAYEEEHVAACTLPGVCYTCYAKIDGIKVDGHNYSDCEIYHNKTEHWQLCQSCGATEKGSHREFCTDVNGYCDFCGFADDFVITHLGYIIPAWEADAINHWQICATCEEAANTEAHVDKDADEKCDVCGMNLAHVHAWGEPVIVEATCTTAGSKTTTCATCGEKTVEVIEATGEHTWGDPVTVEATCAADGSKTTTCTSCGEKTEEIIPMNDDHNWKTVVNVAATCTKKGRTEKTCTVCDETSIVTYAAKGHHEVVDEAKEATSKEDGLTEGKHCDVCGEVIVAQEVIPAVKKESIPMTELEILVNHVTVESQHDNRGSNIPQNGKDFEIPLTKSDKTSKGVVLQVYRDDNETYNAVGLSTTFKKDVTVEIDTWKEEQSVEALQTNNQAIADFSDYFRSLIQVLNPECTAEESEALLLDVLKSISITDENIEELKSAFINGELTDDLRTVIKDGYEYLLVFDGETLSLSVRKIAD